MSSSDLAIDPLRRLLTRSFRKNNGLRLTLHVGMPKTGTTSIQKSMAVNREWLYSVGIHYPRLVSGMSGPGTAHHAVAHALAGPTLRRRIQLFRFSRRVARAASQVELTVISAEPIYRHVLGPRPVDTDTFMERHRAYLRRVANYFEGFDIQVLLYLRRPDTFIVSHYKEAVANGYQPPDLAAYAARHAWLIAYPERISLFRSVFGPPEVRIYETERAAGLLPRFYANLGVSLPSLETSAYLRESPSNRAILWLRRAQQDTQRSRREHRLRTLFATSTHSETLFTEESASTLWPSKESFHAFVERHRRAYEIANLPAPDVAAYPPTVWTDAMHVEAEKAFEKWERDNATALATRTKQGLKYYER